MSTSGQELGGVVVDAHAHLLTDHRYLSGEFLLALSRHKQFQLGPEAYAAWELSVQDPEFGSAQSLLHDMDVAGIGKSVVFASGPFHHGFRDHGYEDTEREVWRANESVATAQAAHPERLIGFVKPDLLSSRASELVRVAIEEWGLRGVKLHPAGDTIDHERFWPLMDTIADLGVPVIVHMGVDPIPFLVHLGNPSSLETLTNRYREMRIVAAHHARGFGDLLSAIISNREGRIFTDLSLWQIEVRNTSWSTILQLRRMMDLIPYAVLFGSDWPWVTPAMSQQEWVSRIANLHVPSGLEALGATDFSDEERRAILGSNALRWLYGASASLPPGA